MINRRTYMIILIITSLLCIFVYLLSEEDGGEEKISQISYIYRGTAEEYSQSSIKQGIEQAAKDFGAEMTIQFLNNTGSAEEQISLIEKESENRTDTILIDPVNQQEVLEKLKEIKASLPVILVNTGFDDYDKFPKISCDNNRLGKDLAQDILENGTQDGTVLMAAEALDFQDTYDKYQGVHDALSQKCRMEVLELPLDEKEKEGMLSERLKAGDIKAVVVFNSRDLELLGKMKRNAVCPQNVLVYGTGKSNQIVADMEDGIIQAVGVTNDYSVGYLSIQKAVYPQSEEKEIRTSIIDKDQIYTKENQRLLFTLVQ